MKFKDLLDIYETEMVSINSRINRLLESKDESILGSKIEFYKGVRYGIFQSFQSTKVFTDDWVDITATRVPTDSEIEQFREIEEDGTINDVSFIVDYRGHSVPVYLDDYGQQYYIILNNKAYGLGTYNVCLDDITYIVDSWKDLGE